MSTIDIPETALAAVLEQYNEPLVVREVNVPQELEANAILTRVESATICGSDVHLCKGKTAETVGEMLPAIPGHEMVGTIVRFGDGTHRDSLGVPLEIGDRIVWTHGSCFSCYACTMLHSPAMCEHRKYYMYEDCDKYPYLVGGLAQYCYVFPGSERVRVPDSLPDHWAAGSSCALRTVVSTFDRLVAPLTGFQTLVIQGAGPLGLFATAYARWHGVDKIIVIGAPAGRLQIAKEWGAWETISVEEVADPDERVRRVRELTDGHGADVVMEFSGGRTAFPEGLEMVRTAGQYLVTGQTTGIKAEVMPALITRNRLTVSGSWSADASQYWKALKFMVKAREFVDFDRLFSDSYSLHEINSAMERMESFADAKPVIDPWR
jgi:L-iditol 2-dehydrogenase